MVCGGCGRWCVVDGVDGGWHVWCEWWLAHVVRGAGGGWWVTCVVCRVCGGRHVWWVVCDGGMGGMSGG